MTNAVLIDICGTLFYSNTTFDFLDYFIKNSKYKFLRKLMQFKIFIYVNNLIYRIIKIDYCRKFALLFLKGINKKELLENAELFYQNFLRYKKNKYVWDYINSLKDKNNIVLVSGTIDPIAEIIAKKIGIDNFISSKLEYNNNLCLGKLETDALKKKLSLLIKNNIIPPYDCIITDNIGDISIMKLSKKSIVILYNNKIRWESISKKINNILFINARNEYGFNR